MTFSRILFSVIALLFFATPTVQAQVATGGSITTVSDGGTNYTVHTFTSSGTFTITGSIPSIEYLIVGGGGGGGIDSARSGLFGGAGGGGAGGFLTGTIALGAASYPISVGGGGAGGSAGVSGTGSNGGTSSFAGNIALGGGGGGGTIVFNTDLDASDGGSGGGAAGFGSVGGSGTAGQGTDGGSIIVAGGRAGNGGGGAGSAGSAPANSVSVGGAGAGLTSSITGASVTYAAGGDGAGGDLATPRGGASGGANTGSGGAGGNFVAGGSGGSGIVIVRYISDETAPGAPTLNAPTVGSDGALTITGTAEPGATVTITFPDGSTDTVVAGLGGIFSISSTPNQPSGVISATATDLSGNVSAATTLSYAATSPTGEAIARFQFERANQLLSNQPNLIHFLSGQGGIGFADASVTRDNGSLNFGLNQDDLPFWTTLKANWSESGTADNLYVLGAIGTHRKINENLLVGAMLQLDYFSQDDGLLDSSGEGWLVGPYFVAKAPNAPLFFEGRLLYGQTSNEISPLGTYTDDFDTERWLLQAKVAGEFTSGTALLSPNVELSYTSDDLEGYIDGVGSVVASQEVETTQLSAGVDFTQPLDSKNGWLEVVGGLTGIYANTNGTGVASTVVPEFEGGRAKFELGLNYGTENGGLLTLRTNVDGVFSDYNSYGVDLRYQLNF